MTLATIQNMRIAKEYHGSRVVAVSQSDPFQECSANPEDYWYLDGDMPLLDDYGRPMELVVRVTEYRDALTGEAA